MGRKLTIFALSLWFVVFSACPHFLAFDDLDLFSALYPCFKNVDPDDSGLSFEEKGSALSPFPYFFNLCFLNERGLALLFQTPSFNSRSSILRC